MGQNDLLETVKPGPAGNTDTDSPSVVLFTDEAGVDAADDIELMKLTSASLGAVVARRC